MCQQNTSLHNIPKPTRYDLERIHSMHYLLSCLQHMNQDDQYGFDERSFTLQFPVRDVDSINEVKDVVFLKLRKHFSFTKDASNIGMIIAGDVNGTRSKTVGQWDHINPHLHALIILPKPLYPKNYLEMMNFKSSFKLEIANLKEYSRGEYCGAGNEFHRRIHFEPYEYKESSIDGYVSYITKADKNYNHKFGEQVSLSVYPYDKELKSRGAHVDYSNPKTRDLAFKLHLFPERVLKQHNLDKLTPWQMYHRELYLDSDTLDEKWKVKNRFLDYIRQYSN